MKTLRTILTAVAGLVLVSACSTIDVEETRKLPSTGTPFQKALHMEYAQLAFEEDSEGDIDNAEMFDQRARLSAQGKAVEPEKTTARELPKDKWAELEAARSALVAALGSGGRDKAPGPSARAQAMFDCWMEEQEENFQPDDIARCRSAFDKALAATEAMVAAARPAPKPMPAAARPPRDFIVYFATDSARLDAKAMAVVAEATAAYKDGNWKQVSVAGHTDTRGSDAYNMDLSDRRADAVTIELVVSGVSGKKLKKSRHGEKRPAVATGDNKNEPRNRRVSIRLAD